MAMMVMEIVESGNRYIFVEETPSQYGGLSKGDFEAADSVNEIIVKPSAQHIVEFSTNQLYLVCFYLLHGDLVTSGFHWSCWLY
ncbi:uncharacterized protein LOC125186642 isoform X3 [Salvia hispanica]|uniref:uncharacterized protein LOC125186642 isoform X3 n=1 Tax=Salvia hispanica TaxID=49212 RepID=UPI002009B940|nr:uncharacterized protein LOC125186642 isoform X3 [Salvia hispanica]